jgi:hypothetical protein
VVLLFAPDPELIAGADETAALVNRFHHLLALDGSALFIGQSRHHAARTVDRRDGRAAKWLDLQR